MDREVLVVSALLFPFKKWTNVKKNKSVVKYLYF